MITTYPTIETVLSADRYTICLWYRKLRSPLTENEIMIMNAICLRYEELGGFTPGISKAIGW